MNDDTMKRIADALEEIAYQNRMGNLIMLNDSLVINGVIDSKGFEDIATKLLNDVEHGKEI